MGSALVPTDTQRLTTGDVVGNGRFAITGILGEGAQATTYEAIDKSSGTVVALKRFFVPRAKSWKDVELAEREAEVLARLAHPGLPRYLTHFEEAGSLFLAMEKVEGQTLAALRAGPGLDRDDVVRFLRDAAETLRYLHAQAPPIVHRDVKPSNVIRRPDGRFVLVDFGSVQHRLRPEGGSTVVGTFGYMAPEQFQGRAMPTTDTYAVGATALALLTGRDPEQLPHKGLGIDVRASLGGSVSEPLTRLLCAALEPDPDQRSRASLGQLLEQHGFGRYERSDASPPPSERDRVGSRASRKEQRRERHRERRARRHGRASNPPPHRVEFSRNPFDRGPARAWMQVPFARLAVLLGLWVARVATGVALLLLVPTLLLLLSIAFGPGLRRAAEQCRRAGQKTQHTLREVAEQARTAGRALRAPREAPGDAGDGGAAGVTEGERTRVRLDEEGADSMDELEREVDAFEARVEETARELEEKLSRRR